MRLSDLPDDSEIFDTAGDAVHYGLDRVCRALDQKNFDMLYDERESLEMFMYLPYAIHPTAIQDQYIVLNRNYKPLGSNAEHWVKYEDYPNRFVHIPAELFEKLRRFETQCAYFFPEKSAPWDSREAARAYLKRSKMIWGRIMNRMCFERTSELMGYHITMMPSCLSRTS